MKEFLDNFKLEIEEILADLEGVLLRISEQESKVNDIAEIFRKLHTIKGGASMFGFSMMEKLAHFLESIYDFLREQEKKISQEIVELTLESVDEFKILIQNNDEKSENYLDLLKRIETHFSLRSGKNPDTSGEKDVNISNDSKVKIGNKILVFFSPDNDFGERGLKIEAIHDELCEIGNFQYYKAQGEIALKSNSLFFSECSPDKNLIEDVFMFCYPHEFSIYDEEEFITKIDEINTKIDLFPKFLENNNLIITEQSNKPGQEKKQTSQDTENISVHVNKTQKVEIVKDEDHNQDNTKNDKLLRIASSKLDLMMNLVSELVTGYSELETYAEKVNDSHLEYIVERFERLTKKFRDITQEVRLMPLREIHQPLQRLVHDLSKQLNKKVEFKADGLDVELDKSVINLIESPLRHIIRNSIDHGIESPEERVKKNKPEAGIIKFGAFTSGTNVIIQIHDDGNGINLDKIRAAAIRKNYIKETDNLSDEKLLELILEPGFSTAEKLSIVSGRGVGMDIVKKELSEVRGSIVIDTERGLGTSITLTLPLTLSILDTLLIESCNKLFLLPSTDIVFCFEETTTVIENQESNHILFENEMIPYLNLRKSINDSSNRQEKQRVIVLKRNDKKYAVVADKIIGEQQSVLKPLGKFFNSNNLFSSASILGNGKMAFLLDVGQLGIEIKKQENIIEK